MPDLITYRAASASVVDVRCDYDSFHRLLCQTSEAGLLLLCKSCRKVHLVSWAQLDQIRELVAFPARTR
jgi:YD repeat-containing protein